MNSASTMQSGENFCLQWNEFQTNVKATYQGLRQTDDFADITLVCEDGQQMKAHRMILSSSSHFFRHMLASLTHSHPLVYMRGVKHQELSKIIDFIYHGEAEVVKEDLETFLAIARELGLKGMTEQVKKPQRYIDGEWERVKVEIHEAEEESTKDTATEDATVAVKAEKFEDREKDEFVEVDPLYKNTLGDNFELEEKIKSMVEMRDGMWTCIQCGKFDNSRFALGRHVETHIEGFTHKCPICDKSFSTRGARKTHKRRQHPEETAKKALKPFNCDICGKPSESMSAIKTHKFRNHKK